MGAFPIDKKVGSPKHILVFLNIVLLEYQINDDPFRAGFFHAFLTYTNKMDLRDSEVAEK